MEIQTGNDKRCRTCGITLHKLVKASKSHSQKNICLVQDNKKQKMTNVKSVCNITHKDNYRSFGEQRNNEEKKQGKIRKLTDGPQNRSVKVLGNRSFCIFCKSWISKSNTTHEANKTATKKNLVRKKFNCLLYHKNLFLKHNLQPLNVKKLLPLS